MTLSLWDPKIRNRSLIHLESIICTYEANVPEHLSSQVMNYFVSGWQAAQMSHPQQRESDLNQQ